MQPSSNEPTPTAVYLMLGFVSSALLIVAAAVFYLAATLSDQSGVLLPLVKAGFFYLLGMAGLSNAYAQSRKAAKQ